LNRYSYRRGWFGNSQGHALAARGVRLYARKVPVRPLVDPMFYVKREEKLPTSHLLYMVDKGMTLEEMKRQYPDMDEEDRKRVLRAMDGRAGNNIYSLIDDTKSVDSLVQQARVNPSLRERMYAALKDPQKSSFLAANGSAVKVNILRERLEAV